MTFVHGGDHTVEDEYPVGLVTDTVVGEQCEIALEMEHDVQF